MKLIVLFCLFCSSCNILGSTEDLPDAAQDTTNSSEDMEKNTLKDMNIGGDLHNPYTQDLEGSCDNTVLDPGEICDGEHLDRHTCKTERFNAGTISCKNCQLDLSQCTFCGDGEIQAKEACDKNNFGGKTCSSERGIASIGHLQCNSDCKAVDTSLCHPKIIQIGGKRDTTCVLGIDKFVTCWGSNKDGIANPPQVEFDAISVGEVTACGIKADHTSICWGNNTWSQIPSQREKFLKISVGWRQTCGITLNNTIKCWGLAEEIVNMIPSGDDFEQINVGNQHACALRKNKEAVCWGKNDFGQTEVTSNDEYLQIAANGRHTCGILTNNKMKCWGNNNSHESEPPSGDFIQVKIGFSRSCAIKTDHQIQCWGKNTSPPTNFFTELTVGGDHGCGLLTNGFVTCWGLNPKGQTMPPPSLIE